MQLMRSKAELDQPMEPQARLGRHDLLFEGLVCDLQWATLHGGILAAVLHAKCQPMSNWGLRPWRHLLMDDANVGLLALRYSSEMGLVPPISEQAIRFYCRLREATAYSVPAFSDDYSSNAVRGQLLSLVKLWRDTGRHGEQTLQGLSGAIGSRLDKCYATNNTTILNFLDAALENTEGLVSAGGEIVFPQLTQRRRTVRIAKKLDCSVRFGSNAASARVIDVSQNGLGLACAERLPEDHPLTVELVNGRALIGRVMWQGADRAGLKLLEPLRVDDPLIAAMAE